MPFSEFTHLCKHHHNLVSERFQHLIAWPQDTTDLFAIPILWPFLDTLSKGNHMVCGFSVSANLF